MSAKEYKVFKSPAKTAKENNLVLTDGISNKLKRLFDFSLLEETKISKEEREVIEEYALKYVTAADLESLYGKAFNNFHTCDGQAFYTVQKVYSQDGKRLYNIFHLGIIKHRSAVRKCVYDDFTVTECQHKSQYQSHSDIEIA